MWLRELQIRNFRRIDALTVKFPRGLTVLVGENNSGKTTIIDALRLMLFSSRDHDSLRLTEDDFRSATEHAPIEISCRFTGLEDEDEVHFQECLVDIGDGKFEMQVNARVEFNETTNRCNVKMWGGETEGGSLPSNHYDRLATIYLQPLRDPERGLRPGQHSQVSRLIDSLTKEDQRAGFETIAKDANEKIRVLKPVEDARGDINAQMAAIAGSELAQKTELIFADLTFRRIIAGLQPEIEGLPFALNGLGYNNLIFTSVVCRAHGQLESLRGKVNYTNLKGKARDLATAAFLRDSRHDYRGASQTVERIVRELTGDDPLWERIDTDPKSRERMAVALAIWKFVKNPDRLTPVSQLGDTWIPSMRTQLASLIEEVGLQCDAKLGQHIKATGLSAAQKALPLFESVHEFPDVRQDTIHQVKGESIDAVLVIGSTKFWNSVMEAVRSGDNTEDRRLAYVAMTRARHLLVVGLPKGHYDKHLKTWVEWGFKVAT